MRIARWVHRFGLAVVMIVFAASTSAVNAQSSADTQANEKLHCATEVTPGGGVTETRCFNTVAEMMSFVTGGRIQLSATARPSEISREIVEQYNVQIRREAAQRGTGNNVGTLNVQPMQTSVVIGIWWQLTGFRDTSHTLTTTTLSACANGTTYGSPGMPSGWNDRPASAQSYDNCRRFENYADANWQGDRIVCSNTCNSLGIVNKRVSSWRITG